MNWVAGIDECGYGSWAGPLVVSVALVPAVWTPPQGLTDSKALTEKRRLYLESVLSDSAEVRYDLLWAWPNEIDAEGVGPVRARLFRAAVAKARSWEPDCRVILDGNLTFGAARVECYPKADLNFPCASAASVLGKVRRDDYMIQAHARLPFYAFDCNKGYHSLAHVRGLEQNGVSEEHRLSYAPVKRYRAA